MEEKKKHKTVLVKVLFFFFKKQVHNIHIFGFYSVKPLQRKKMGGVGGDTILLKLLLQLLLQIHKVSSI